MNKQKPMATIIINKQVSMPKASRSRASRLFDALSRRPQASRLQPKVFCDPKMPGGWRAIAETAADRFAA